MLPRPRTALIAALACLAALAATGVLAYLVPVAHARDSAALNGFVGIGGPRLGPLLDRVAHLADPDSYGLLGGGLVLIAAARRRWRLVVAIAAVLVAAPATSELLKPLLAHPRPAEWLGPSQIAAASWPSGHATAAMTLALLAVLAVPAVLRPLAAVAGGLFALAVSYSVLALHWHFPSDVVGGYLVAAAWTLLAVAALRRWPGPGAVRARRPDRHPVLAAAPAAGLAGFAAGAVGLVALARPHAVAVYLTDRPSFVIAAGLIAGLALVLAVALALALRG